MSVSDNSVQRSRQDSSVDSSDENFFDPGRMDSADEPIAGMMGMAIEEEFHSEISHLKLGSATKASDAGRSASPDDGKEKAYTQLKNYAGLSGPSTNSRLVDDQGSNRGSFISSLSSHSLEGGSPRALDFSERKPRSSVSSNEASEDDNNEPAAETPPTNAQFQYTEEEKARMKLVFQQIFSCVMPSNNGVNVASNTIGNGSDHGSSVARENIYYRERVKVTTSLPAKETKFKDKTRLVQTLKFHQGAIWAMKFSPCGGFLCTAGQDMNVVIWCIGSLPADAHPNNTEEKTRAMPNLSPAAAAAAAEETNTNRRSFGSRKTVTVDTVDLKPFIHPIPYRVLEGHTGDIIDLAWSKSKFILSASTDKTVCLWHVSRRECLQFFRHPDIVTAVEFHPAHDRYYISGCFDRKLRVWDIIPDGIVQEWTQTTDTITSICFSPDGKTVAGGLIQGKVFFYDLVDFDQLKYKTQMNCRNGGGKYSRGTKVTGMAYRNQNANYSDLEDGASGLYKWRRQSNNHRPNSMQQAPQLLVSTNDNRLRLCRLDDYSLVCKYKGLRNKTMQIKASFSGDGGYVICGSEAGSVFIWNTLPKKKSALSSFMTGNKNRNDGYECIECSSAEVATTVAVFAPVDSVLTHLLNNDYILSSPLPSAAAIVGTALSGPTGSARADAASNAAAQNSTNRESISGGRPESIMRGTADYSSRVVVTADFEGSLKIYFRLS